MLELCPARLNEDDCVGFIRNLELLGKMLGRAIGELALKIFGLLELGPGKLLDVG